MTEISAKREAYREAAAMALRLGTTFSSKKKRRAAETIANAIGKLADRLPPEVQ